MTPGGVPEPGGFDRIAHRYDETRGGEERGDRFAAALASLLDPEQPVLEVGVGTGVVALGLMRRRFEVIGLDIAPAMARRARARIGARVVIGDAARMPFRSGAFRQALSVWVLHLIPDPVAVLRELRRVLVAGGRYLVQPARGRRAIDEIDRIVEDMQRRIAPEWSRRQRDDVLAAAAAEAGLEVAGVEPLPPSEFRQSPEEVAANIETRAYSTLWDLGEDEWRERVVPAIEALRALPNPEVPVRRETRERVIVLRRPG